MRVSSATIETTRYGVSYCSETGRVNWFDARKVYGAALLAAKRAEEAEAHAETARIFAEAWPGCEYAAERLERYQKAWDRAMRACEKAQAAATDTLWRHQQYGDYTESI